MIELEKEIPDSHMEYTNTSRVINVGPCIVLSVMLAANGANGDCQVYDGVNAKGKLKAHIEAVSGTTFYFVPPGGALFRNGLYIAVNANTSKVTVTLKPISPKNV